MNDQEALVQILTGNQENGYRERPAQSEEFI